MQKTAEQLQADLDREKAYTTKLNLQIDRLRDQLRNTISLSEHERILLLSGKNATASCRNLKANKRGNAMSVGRVANEKRQRWSFSVCWSCIQRGYLSKV